MLEGQIISWKKGQTVTDGSFAESKEAIGGYFLLRVKDRNEAVEIAKKCSILKYGLTVEVQPLAEQCPTIKHLNEQECRELMGGTPYLTASALIFSNSEAAIAGYQRH